MNERTDVTENGEKTDGKFGTVWNWVRDHADILVVLCLTAMVYANSIDNGFHYDDYRTVIGNKAVHRLVDVTEMFRAYPSRPTLTLTLAVNYAFGKLDPTGYHMLTLALHLAAVWLVYLFMKNILATLQPANRHRWMPAIAAMLFGLHPIHTEAVNYVSARSDVLAGVLCLSALILFARLCAGGNTRWPAMAGFAACYIAGLGSDEVVLTLPALLLLYDFLFVALRDVRMLRRRWYIHVPVWLASAISVFLNVPPVDGRTVTFATQMELVARNARLILAPIGLNIHHSISDSAGFFTTTTMLSTFAVGLLITVGIWLLRRRAPAGYGIMWFLITLIPASAIVSHNALIAEHNVYLPAVGFAVAGAWLLGMAIPSNTTQWRTTMQSAGGVCIVLVGVIYSASTCSRNTVWDDGYRLWTDAYDKGSRDAVTVMNLARASVGRGAYYRALDLYGQANDLDPDNPAIHGDLASLHLMTGNMDAAISEFERAAALEPDNAGRHADLARALDTVGRTDEARAENRRALDLDPDQPAALYMEGKVRYRSGNFQAAADMFERAISFRPNAADYHDHLGMTYVKLGDAAASLLEQGPLYTRAIASHQRAIDLDLESAGSHYNIGNAYARLDRTRETIAAYEKAIQLRPDWANPYINLGGVLLESGRPKEALDQFNKALDLDPNIVLARFNRGVALLQLERTDEMIREFTTLVDEAPGLAPNIHLMIGHARMVKNDVDGARKAFKAALDARPGFQEAQAALDALDANQP